MDLQLIGGGALSVAEEAFGKDFNEPLVHQAVTACLAGARSGTKAQKSRSEVRGGGAKPWRQKGTGRARSGTIRSPVWRSGGVTFAARPRNHAQKINKKMYRAAMRSILSELVRQERLSVVESLTLDTHKTRDLAGKLAGLEMSDVLVVVDVVDKNMGLASRNLPRVVVTDIASLNPVSLLRHERVLMTAAAVKKIEEWLA